MLPCWVDLLYHKFWHFADRAHVLETCRGMKQTYCKTKMLCIKLVNYWDKLLYHVCRVPFRNSLYCENHMVVCQCCTYFLPVWFAHNSCIESPVLMIFINCRRVVIWWQWLLSIGNENIFLKISHLILVVIFTLPNANTTVTSIHYRDSFFMFLQAHWNGLTP